VKERFRNTQMIRTLLIAEQTKPRSIVIPFSFRIMSRLFNCKRLAGHVSLASRIIVPVLHVSLWLKRPPNKAGGHYDRVVRE
jgi:hypothetical protein